MTRKCIPVLLVLLIFGSSLPGAAGAGESILWRSYDEAVELGKKHKKKVLVHFYASWCFYCRKMAKETFEASDVVSYVNERFVAVMVDIDRDRKTAAAFGVRAVPDTWFLTEAGEGIDHVPGLVPPDHFLSVLRQVAGISASGQETKGSQRP